jgi:hypothetical protein
MASGLLRPGIVLMLGLCASLHAVHAAPVTWSGLAGNDFENPGNWSALPASDLTNDTAVFAGSSAIAQPQVTTNRSIAGLAFTTPAGGWELSRTNNAVLSLGTNGLSSAGQTNGTNTIAADLQLAAAQTWAAGSGGTLLVTGSVLGTNGFPLTVNSGTNLGTVVLSPAAGRSVNLTGGASNMLVAVRSGGTLVLGGDGTNTIFNSGPHGALTAISNGTVAVNSGTWNVGDLGRNGSADFFSGTLNVNGGTITLGGSRFLAGGTINVNGGILRAANNASVYVNGGKFAPGSVSLTNGTAVVNVTGGLLDLAQANNAVSGGNSLGVGMNTRMSQSGGTVQVGLTAGGGTNGGTSTSLTIGHSGMSSSGSGTNIAYTPVSNLSASYTLNGGTLLVAGPIQGTTPATPATNGTGATNPGAVIQPGTNNVRNFNFLGGTLAGANFNATNLGYASATGLAGGPPHADPAANSVGQGTLYNHGGTVAPGGTGTAGRTTIGGNYTALAGVLAIDIGGTNAATNFQSGTHDILAVNGAAALGGTLAVTRLSAYTPATNLTFTILTSTNLTGSFANVPFGSRVVTTDGLGTFVVNKVTNSVTLGQYQAVTAPTVVSTSMPDQIALADSVVLGITVNSLAPPTYVWRKDGEIIPGANSSSLALIGLEAPDLGNYEVTASNAAGTITRTFNVRVTTPPSTAAFVIDAGSSRTFEASPGAVSYQWILDGDPVGTGPTYTYSPNTKAVGTHWLRVVETYGSGSPVTRNFLVRVRIPTPASTINYHVSPTGSDTNNGSAGAPFRTLERARDTIRALPRPLPAGGVTVFLRGGVHRRTNSFVLGATDSGTPAAPVVYAAHPGEEPILTGARALLSSQFTPLAASETNRVAPGVNPAQVFEVSVAGVARATNFPSVFNEWVIFNPQRSTLNGGLLEVFQDGERLPLSRYPNVNPTNDMLTPSMLMDGVATGAADDGTGYLNGAGIYTDSNGVTNRVGGAFRFKASDAARFARWQTAMTRGGIWLQGRWRVPWQVNGVRVSVLDTGTNRTIGFITNTIATNAIVPNGIGNKYVRPAGSSNEPYWALNLLEEMDVPGEWAIDFSRARLYLLRDTTNAPADGAVELSDLGSPLVAMTNVSNVRFQSLTFRRHLGNTVQMVNGTNNLLLGCDFRQTGALAVDINGGASNGVVSGDFENLAAGGVMLRGGQTNPAFVNTDHFVVNNKFRSFGQVVRVYQGAIDSGFGGPIGSWSQNSVGTRIANNDVRTTPHGAVYWGGHNQVIEYNDIRDHVRVSEDMGAIYRFGPNYQANSVIRYNHVGNSPLGEAYYNDKDHVKVAIYGNVGNLRTPASAGRGYGLWTTTPTATNEAVPGVDMRLNVYNNILVNSRINFVLHSATNGVIQNNVAYRPLSADFQWRRVTTDTNTLRHTVTTSSAAELASGPNIGYASDPGFIDFANDDLRLRPDSVVYSNMPGFVPIPHEMAGLYNDEFRSDAPVRTPFVVTRTATAVGANTAVFTGTLAYPQFDANATVLCYYGTSDGGTEPTAWQFAVNLGTPGSGHVAHTAVNLDPSTRYYFRFYAVNSAGEHWAEASNSTTTFPLGAAPGGGTASTDSGGQPASNAFDGNAATSWQSQPGTTTARLDYQFAGDAAVRVTRYEVTSSADNPSADPRDWQFLGSYDGTTWVVLDTRAGVSFASRGQTLVFNFANNAAFKFYRLDVTTNNGDPSLLQLAELKLYTPQVAPDTAGPVITTPGNITVSGTAATGAVVEFDVFAEDALSGHIVPTVTPASGSFFNLGTTTVNVSATDPAGNTSTASFTVTVTVPPLPAPWTLQQVHPYTGAAAGTAAITNGTGMVVVGRGGATNGGTTGDLWTGNNDSFTYVSQPWQGDGVFTARLTTFNAPDSSAKAGIIFRESTAMGARYSAIYLLRSGNAWAQHKTAQAGSSNNVNFFTNSTNGVGIPEWVRLVRQGDVFTCFRSPDGTNWTQLGPPRTNPLSGPNLSVGLFVAPRTGGQAATNLFENITFVAPRDLWRQNQFGTTNNSGQAADSADPDRDGRPNILEYATATSPTNAAGQANVGTQAVQEDRLTLTFTRVGDPRLTYTVEATSLPGGTWDPVWQSTGGANIAGPVTVTDEVDLSSLDPRQRFMRLKVSAPTAP